MESSSFQCLLELPTELHHGILKYLSAQDLCHMALCNRCWRDMANQDALWRPLCRRRRWEHFGTTEDLCNEVPISLQGGNTSTGIAFPTEAVVAGSDWPTLAQTCKWKEVYMRAQHLEANWINNRCHTVSFEFGAAGCQGYYYNIPESERSDPNKTADLVVNSLNGEGDCLAASLSNGSLKMWDMSSGECQHTIRVNASNSATSLKVKSGIVVVGCKDGWIRTFSSETGEQLRVLGKHQQEVTHVFFDGEIIISTAHPEDERHVDKESDEDSSEYERGDVEEPQDNAEVKQAMENDILVFRSGDASSFLLCYGSGIFPLVYVDYRDKIVAAAFKGSILCLWDAQSGIRLHTIHTGMNFLVSCHLDDGVVIGTNHKTDPVLKVWSLSSGQLMEAFAFPNVKLFDNKDTLQISSRVLYHFDWGNPFLVARSKFGELGMFGLVGSFCDTTDIRVEHHLDFLCVIVSCLYGNRIIAGDYCDARLFLLTVSATGGFKLVREVRPLMYDSFTEMDDIRFHKAWMSATKLVFVSYFVEKDELEKEIQVPKIVVHHYW